jgi:hypothetical protein|tara:strand:+ start:575 stop:760 length:186 start_codon:yes stop_codon:yes gene_type:complete
MIKNMVKDYWLEIAMPDGELMIWEMMSGPQVLELRNKYMRQGLEVRTGIHEKVVDTEMETV